MDRLAIVFGTFDRKILLQQSITSIRKAVGKIPYDLIIIDGGSTDGSREYLAQQSDVILIGQRLPLTGAVHTFNLGFGYAVDHNYKWVCHFNDDAEFVTDNAIEKGIEVLDSNPRIGCVAFEAFMWGRWGWDGNPLYPYSNFGIVKTEVGKRVAERQGDPTGRLWWNPIYYTYAADTEFGYWIWKMGYRVEKLPNIRVMDHGASDGLRKVNTDLAPQDQSLYRSRWPTPISMAPPADVIPKGAKLHLCCGQKRLEGWFNVDGLHSGAIDYQFEIRDLDKIPNHHLSRIYWSHGPEHIPPDLLPGVFQQLKRILQPGGLCQVATIDFQGIYLNRFLSPKNGGAWNAALYGETASTDHPYLAHRIAFTHDSLSDCFRGAGFSDVKKWNPDQYPEIITLNDYAVSCRLVTCHVEGIA